MRILISYYHLYEGHWDDENFKDLITQTGFTKKQLNKWFWDRKRKENRNMEIKKLTYPGLIFQITNMQSGEDLTPSFMQMAKLKPLFRVIKSQE